MDTVYISETINSSEMIVFSTKEKALIEFMKEYLTTAKAAGFDTREIGVDLIQLLEEDYIEDYGSIIEASFYD